MKYIIAYDGGGTKTHFTIFDHYGNLKYEKIGSGCNHASTDGHLFQSVIENLFNEGKNELSISNDEISFIFLGLSGADLESDFIKLNKACKSIFHEIPFKVVNDAWIVMRSGLKSPYVAVAISGTGTNSAAMNHLGEKAILRSLGFTLGIYGGGLDIAREALHYAFRADEMTHMDTMLKNEIPLIFNLKEMSEVVDLFYPVTRVTKKEYGTITALVNKCAVLGDLVSIEILSRLASFVGEQTAGVMKKVGIDQEIVPVVIGGKVFSGEAKYYLESFEATLKKECPKSYIVKPKYQPVVGAYLFALDELGIKQDEKIENNLDESCVHL
ncbi:MAG: BadF/BadG/BcrA/BcrD ATPase family protein [Acholeplasmataceae bacterium]|nr:BadF/BadG/BcrA/BcrD ATPase family protein [Acholeplasmataceae bacterium]